MQSLVAFNGLIEVVVAILAINDREKALKERHIKDPIHKEYHITEESNDVFGIVLPIFEEVIHV